MQRKKAIQNIIKRIKDKDIIVSSCGYISRELYWLKDRPLNFYVMGSMGAEIGIGIGLAHNTNLNVHVITGDGSCLMALGTYNLAKNLCYPNLRYYILNNQCYESTGGQSTCPFPYDKNVIYIKKSKHVPKRIPLRPKEITRRFKDVIRNYM